MINRIVVFILAVLAPYALASPPVLIGLDAEFGHVTSTSAQAVEQGIRIAIDEINRAGGILNGRKLDLVLRDNRSITAIGVDNFRELAAIPDLVAVFGGKFSPIYIECLPVAHELGLLLLDPWGSANPITDHGFSPSYTFRLSLKDAWAAPAFVKYAREQHKATRLGVLLPNTSWGRSNQEALSRAAAHSGTVLVGARWYNWGDTSLMVQFSELRKQGAQAIVLIANEVEGALLVREVAALPKEQRLPIISHWGITGGEFFHLAGTALQEVDFSVIQTFSFVGLRTPVGRRVIGMMQSKYGITDSAMIKSPVGIAHAYDLTHLLARAIEKAGSTDRRKVRDAMENLGPYEGLVRKYTKPFDARRHDALSAENVFFARYQANEKLIPVARR